MWVEEFVMHLKEAFGPRLRELRGQRGLTRAQLASACDLPSTRSLENLEAGRNLPSLEMAVKLAVALEVGIDEMIGLDAPTRRPKK
jgi:transcriptional regulator with XRE-family HTH domain